MKRGDVNPETQRLMQELLRLEPDAVLVFRDSDPTSDSEGPVIVSMLRPPVVVERLRDAIRIARQV